MNLARRIAVALLAMLSLVATAGCASSGAVDSIDTSNAVVIDVRTPAEFAGAHLQGAVDIDIEQTNWVDKIVQYPVDGRYLLYDRTGARAATALLHMKSMGFTDVTNLGDIDQAAKLTGLPVVTS